MREKAVLPTQDSSMKNEIETVDSDHLVVMVNGILGSVTDWKFAASEFVVRMHKLVVHCSSSNVGMQTMDGVDVMGERLADEIKELIQINSNITKISIVSHSVGGLVARYAIGILYKPPENNGTICGLEPINFITVATPHLGSRGHCQVPFLFGLPFLEKTANLVIHLIFRRTGRHLFLNDNDHGKAPLLRRLLQDNDQYYFMSALRAFKRRVIYSNVGYDNIVGWRTSSIRRNYELPKWEDSVSEKYPHIVHEELCKAYDVEQSDLVMTDDESVDKIEEDLIIGLSCVSWEKIDVSFHTSKQRSDAHSIIQVKDEAVHSEGADVIQHMIDHFHL